MGFFKVPVMITGLSSSFSRAFSAFNAGGKFFACFQLLFSKLLDLLGVFLYKDVVSVRDGYLGLGKYFISCI